MTNDLANWKQQLDTQIEQLLVYLSHVGLGIDANIEIPDPDPESPLAEIVAAFKLLTENLAVITRERDENLRQAQAKTIERQARAILDLSTPVIQIWDDILVMPLIGTIDTVRAQQAMSNLLEEIVKRRVSVVIQDVTGVPVVDTKVANHLLNTIDAARMLGATVILTGVSPHNAQTLVRLGVDLSRIITRSTLQAGLKLAFEMTGQGVVRKA
jgi:rsbT co-antagonist protein RsbR